MAEIVSVSLPSGLVKEVSRMQKRLQFRNRSELFRASLEALNAENEEVDELKGNVSGVLSAMHEEPNEPQVVKLRHEFHDIVITAMHHEFKRACVELFLLEGPADRVKEMYYAYKRHPKTKYVRLLAES